MSSDAIVHAVFGYAAAGSLKPVLGSASGESLIVLDDDLSIGPIDRTDGESRTRWLQEQFRHEAYEKAPDIDGFWSAVASGDNRMVAWVSRRNAIEHAGLLELLRRRGEASLEIVDVTNVESAGSDQRPSPALSLGIAELGATQIIARGLRETAAPLSPSAAASYAKNWAQLRRENASLRIIQNDVLVSAPISHFDDRVVASATGEWQSSLSVLDSVYRTARAERCCLPDTRFMFARLVAIVRSGQLGGRGDFSTLDSPPTSWIRLIR
jgi:hypothetical protein